MGHDKPLISIVTATYNRANVLRYTIESVLRSTYTNWELLVIGDALSSNNKALPTEHQIDAAGGTLPRTR